MTDIMQARRESHDYRSQPGLPTERITGQAFYPGADAPRTENTVMEGLADLPKAVGSAAAGLASGAVGIPGDLAALAGGLASAMFPGDQGRIEAATDTMTKISEAVGSERFLGLYRDFVNNSDFDDEDKKMMLDVAEGSSFFSVPGAGTIAATSRGAIKEGVVAAGKAADERIAERAADTGVTLAAGADPMPAIDKALSVAGRSVRPSTEELKKVLDLRAQQMELPVAKRLKPRTDQPLFELDYQKNIPEQKEVPVPRAPEGKTLPKFNRAAKVIEMSDQIADVLAKRAQPFVGTNVQFFYHTGPIIDKAVSLGIPEDRARAQLRKFAENYAATSPKTETEPNLRSASLVTAKQKAGLRPTDIIGVGSGGVNEKGYPMMINPGGLHLKLIDAAAAEGFNFDTNPKPATFVENVSGNLSGVTADTHAIRAVFSAMNEIEPGSVPLGFIGGKQTKTMSAPEVRKQNQDNYKKDPSTLNVATMIADTLGSQKIDGKDVQTEYAVFSDIYKKVAEKLGVQPAEAQSLSWFANGEKTGLGSAPKTIVELIDERVDVTAQALNQSKDEVFKKFMQGSIPLLSLGGLTLLDTGAAQEMMEVPDGQDS
ncbi:MAG: hypothetical protein CMQ13_08290 [Gammaproteobacteria bacterium]|nr:hypothetical protein [Gammaproteobacteria bacterium]|tara:strand:+ start:6128 stop:7927 length:1800 start_codon:yes stop_codon:yes gene_type:complete